VEVGRLEEQARRLNEGFARYIRHRTPLVTLKSAMTLDGKIAPSPAAVPGLHTSPAGKYSGNWITGEAARAHVHELRHQHDAILVGIGTILSDDPLLTDRSARPRRRPLLRVVLDSRLRLPLESRLVQSVAKERKNDLVVFCFSADERKKSRLEQIGVRVERIPAKGREHLELPAVLHRLGEMEITTLMIEGGATVNSAAIAANVIDKVFFYYAPEIFGGAGSVPFAAGMGFPPITQALQVKNVRLHRFGEDVAVEGYFRDPYQE
jgi:diaminohydroxyphosphoribosylaminopyrimidine deaminase / 5-amino-6-(5-phosphoribosylamino)uracil reductase